VPTDPFVNPDPSARPRQQQNLPPGVALPPASSWESNRPGDLGPRQPAGALLGTPGPNVGYAYTLANRVKDRLHLAPTEHLEDAIAVIAEIAGRRAATYGRAPVIGDVEFACSFLGYDGSAAAADFEDARARIVHGAAHDYPRRRAIVDAVPEALFGRRPSELKGLVDEFRARLRAQVAAPPAA
jgi:hypothetical protein